MLCLFQTIIPYTPFQNSSEIYTPKGTCGITTSPFAYAVQRRVRGQVELFGNGTQLVINLLYHLSFKKKTRRNFLTKCLVVRQKRLTKHGPGQNWSKCHGLGASLFRWNIMLLLDECLSLLCKSAQGSLNRH